MPAPRIAIIGAGPGGLTLARLLHVNGIPTTIFEKDPSREFRHTAGGCLDLHEHSGQKALRDAGLEDEFKKHARYDGEALVLTDRFGEEHINIKDVDTGRPEIDRPALRDMLLASVPDEYVRWGHGVTRVDAEEGTLHFENSRTAQGFDLIVGADGAWSKVRKVLCTVSPFYSGVTGLEWWLRDIDRKDPKLSAVLGDGSYFSFGDEEGRCLGSQRQGDRSVRTYAFLRKHESWVKDCGVNWEDREAAKEALRREFKAWPEKLTAVIEAWDEGAIIPRPLYMLPVGVRWPHQKGFTLLGDAAHLMTPFAGEGVNAAMWDAMELANAIIADHEDLDRAVWAYETKLFPRAEKIQQMTWDSTRSRFDRGGVKHLKERFSFLLEKRAKGEKVTDAGIGAEVTE
ncbi:Monooxygenase FAD-binding protein [Macrophomina phaseolina MS6]|uniref:Monooxygenase FAD-binding protein n=1 Tax=Macrophomina phaseolina (strain MS6) TaxID=1126212 RepID=K2RPJ6_MACPH|nr:Monooxygenase FAD-binding protein [Macrophomina phaseolina MS6]